MQNWKPFLKTWKLLCSLREMFALLCHCLPPNVKIPLTSRSENPNSGQRPKLLGPQRNRKWPPIVMAGVWAANFGHLYPTLVPDDWRWRCFMRPIYLIAPFLDCPSKMSLWKQDSKDIGICPPFISFKYFHWSCTILVRRLPATRHCVKREPTQALVSVQGFCESHATHFHTLGKSPTNATIVTKSALLHVIRGSIYDATHCAKREHDVRICKSFVESAWWPCITC